MFFMKWECFFNDQAYDFCLGRESIAHFSFIYYLYVRALEISRQQKFSSNEEKDYENAQNEKYRLCCIAEKMWKQDYSKYKLYHPRVCFYKHFSPASAHNSREYFVYWNLRIPKTQLTFSQHFFVNLPGISDGICLTIQFDVTFIL